jgi:hypothetical protein
VKIRAVNSKSKRNNCMKTNLAQTFLLLILTLYGVLPAQAQPILQLTSVSTTSAEVSPGDSAVFLVTITNAAQVPTTGVLTANDSAGGAGVFPLRLTSNEASSIDLGAANVAVPPIPAGSAVTLQISRTVPTKTSQAASYFINLGSVSGVAGLSPTSVSTAGPSLRVKGSPDLQITSLAYAASTAYVGGQSISMTLAYRNNSSTKGVANVPYVPARNGAPSFVRIQVVLSANAVYGDGDDFQLTVHDIASQTDADDTIHTLVWNQLLPGNFSGSYYVMAKVDSLDKLPQNDPESGQVNGNNIWSSNSLNLSGTTINLLPSTFPTTALVSHAQGDSRSASGYSDNPTISTDGRYVAFASDAQNLAGGSGGVRSIYVFDNQTGTVRRVSTSQQGNTGNGNSTTPAISGLGRYVAFVSEANNLLFGDTNGFADIFIVDTITGLIARQSVSSNGGQADNPSFKPSVSDDGRLVVFQSTATNLVTPATVAGVSHIYLHNRDVKLTKVFDTPGNTETTLIDVTPTGVAGDRNSLQPVISGNGRYVAFASSATTLTSSDLNNKQDIFVRDLLTSTTRVASVAKTTGAQGNADSQTPSISADGRYVAFASLSDNLVVGDANLVSDIFVYDMNAPVGVPVVSLISVPGNGGAGTDPSSVSFRLGSVNPSISADGRYIAFSSLLNNLTAGDAVGQASPGDANNAVDVFVRDRDVAATGVMDTPGNASTVLVSVNSFGYQTAPLLSVSSTAASNIYPAISGNGRFIAFPSDAESLGGLVFGSTNQNGLDANSSRDIFLSDRKINALSGGTSNVSVSLTSPSVITTAQINTPVTLKANATVVLGSVSSVQFFVNGTSIGSTATFPYQAVWTPTATGTYILSALATDSFNNQAASSNATVTVNAPSSVGMGALDSTTLSVGKEITLTANAEPSSSNVTIKTVQFFANNVPIGTATSSPYSVKWTPPAAGIYLLTATAIDSTGLPSTSDAVRVTAGDPPVVSITIPKMATSGSTVVAVNSSLTITATASSPSGSVASVQFFADATSVGTRTSYPYEISWTPTALGTYSLTAVVTDNIGVSITSSAVKVESKATGLNAPDVKFSPALATAMPVNVAVKLTAVVTPATGFSVSGVQFFANGSPIGSAPSFPYTVTWTPASTGTFSISAVAVDNAGNQGATPTATVTVAPSNTAPTAAFSPTPPSTASVNLPQSLTAEASATSGFSITRVQFFANETLLGTVTTYPYTINWQPTVPGVYSLVVVSTDNTGNTGASAAARVTVTPGTAPGLKLTSPIEGATYSVGNAILVSSSATLGSGLVTGVDFLVNGLPIGSAASQPFSTTFTPSAAGVYVFTAIVKGNTGTTATSAPVSVTVRAAEAPTVAITSPGGSTTTPVNVARNITAEATANGQSSLVSVQFFDNGVGLGTDTTFPYSTTWTPTSVGGHSLTAVATDSGGQQTTSTGISVVVESGTQGRPYAYLTSAPDGAILTRGAPFTLAAAAGSSSSPISLVSFYDNGVFIGSKASPPYSIQVSPNAARAHTFTAVAEDENGASTTTTGTTLTWSQPIGALPTATLRFNDPSSDTPTAISFAPVKVAYGSKLLLTVDPLDPDGSVSSVQFFVNGAPLSVQTAAPYSTVYVLSSLADAVISAIVTDSDGNAVQTNLLNVSPQSTVSAVSRLVTLQSPASGTTHPEGAQIAFSATHNFGTNVPVKIDFYVDGVLARTAAGEPYQATFGLPSAGNYVVQAVARAGIMTTVSTPVRIAVTSNSAPQISITGPLTGSSYGLGTSIPIRADAGDLDGTIKVVQFFVNGSLLSAKSSGPYTASWTPTSAGNYVLVAEATDDAGNKRLSAPSKISIRTNQSPVVVMVSPEENRQVSAGTPVTLNATATDYDGTVVDVRFLSNGNPVGSSSSLPFSATWTPSVAGTYSLVAEATDNSGNVGVSASVSLRVSSNRAPVVRIVSPANGAVAKKGVALELSAEATDPDGTIGSVQFFANGTAISTPIAAANATTKWTPPSEGVFTITAAATDNAGALTTSSSVSLLVVNASSEGGDIVYLGNYAGGGEAGQFALVNARGKTVTFIAYSTAPAGRIYFHQGVPVDAGGGFLVQDTTGRRVLVGSVSGSGVSGTMDASRLTFIGPVGMSGVSSGVAAGYYTGNMSGRGTSSLAAIVGADSTLTLYAADGSTQHAGAGSLDAQGRFTLTTTTGVAFAGRIDPLTGFMSGTVTGSTVGFSEGAFTGSVASSVSFSDGSMRNLSTRGQVGTGSDVLIAGFVVGGSTPKQVLVRAIGPSLSNYGVENVLLRPSLRIFSGNVLLGSNDGWGGDGPLVAATARVGAFPLNPTSLDAVVLLTLAPGNYTAVIGGNGGTSGVALVELYDVDAPTAFSAQKVMNVSTRGMVGAGQAQLIAGFVINGSLSKQLLIRAVGPTLGGAPFNIEGALADPRVRVLRGDGSVVRENDNWGTGNDIALLNAAISKVGAFPLAAGGRDAALLISLPPGLYTVQVDGINDSSGVALVEVYEVP